MMLRFPQKPTDRNSPEVPELPKKAAGGRGSQSTPLHEAVLSWVGVAFFAGLLISFIKPFAPLMCGLLLSIGISGAGLRFAILYFGVSDHHLLTHTKISSAVLSAYGILSAGGF
jgi:hypothetical protein